MPPLNLATIPTPALAEELISRPDGRSALARLVAGRRVYAKKLQPCPKCGVAYGVADLRKHIPLCPMKATPSA